MRRVYKVDGAASEATAGHARAMNARLPPGDFHHDVQLPATDLIIVPQTTVRLCHQLAQNATVAGFESIRRFAHALILGDHVPAALVQRPKAGCDAASTAAWSRRASCGSQAKPSPAAAPPLRIPSAGRCIRSLAACA